MHQEFYSLINNLMDYGKGVGKAYECDEILGVIDFIGVQNWYFRVTGNTLLCKKGALHYTPFLIKMKKGYVSFSVGSNVDRETITIFSDLTVIRK